MNVADVRITDHNHPPTPEIETTSESAAATGESKTTLGPVIDVDLPRQVQALDPSVGRDAKLRFDSDAGLALRQQLATERLSVSGDENLLARRAGRGRRPQSRIDAPAAQELIDGYNRFNAIDSDLPALTRDQERAIRHLNPTERQMFNYSLGKLAALQAGKIDAAEYMFSTMETAATLANNGEGVRFDRLIGMAFSAGPAGGAMGLAREFLGTSADPAGAALENMHNQILRGQGVEAAHGGFNENIINDSNVIDDNVNRGIPVDTVTHHFREFFLAGVSGRRLIDNLPYNPFELARTIDDGVPGPVDQGENANTRNEGDIRNGMFAAMVGQGYANGDITSSQVVKLTQWAFSESPGTRPPPWGTTAENGTIANPGTWLDRRLYDSKDALDNWIMHWQWAHPNETF